MAVAFGAYLIFSIVGCRLTSLQAPEEGHIAIAVIFLIAALQFFPVYLHTKGKIALRDAVLTIPWVMLFWALLPFPVDIAARLGMGIHLKDASLVRVDELWGISVPAIMRWSSQHWIGSLATRTYMLLTPMLLLSAFLPGLTGKVKHSQQFLLANVVAFALGLPFFALVPAIGPWYGYNFSATLGQARCQADLLQLRNPAVYLHHASGPICFPSFHVMWAILCVQALWVFRPLRIPSVVLAFLIIFSTMSTGWHYFSDVLGGVALATVSISVARWLNRD
jgi:membrane-associated phospholipid phosphatase